MLSLQQLESDLISAMKARDSLTTNTLRGLKARIQNEQVAKMVPELKAEEIVILVKSEIKRRKEAAESFTQGGSTERAEQELKEAAILEQYLPPQLSEEQIAAAISTMITENNFTAKDFGAAMGKLKATLGQSADGAVLAKLLKEKLK